MVCFFLAVWAVILFWILVPAVCGAIVFFVTGELDLSIFVSIVVSILIIYKTYIAGRKS